MITRNPIASLFRTSPFGPLQEHMKVVIQCAKNVVPLFEALDRKDLAEVGRLRNLIADLEKQADGIKNDIRTHLPKGLFMPVDRRDLLDLLRAQDSIADRVQDAAAMVSFGIEEVPSSLREGLLPFVRRNLDAALKCEEVVLHLDELLEVGFSGKVVERINLLVTELSAIETATDDLGRELTRELVRHETDISTASFVLWYDLLSTIGDIADHSENVGDRLRLLIAR